MKILVIEDEPGIRETLRDVLELNGHEVNVAEDGSEGVSLLAQGPEFIFCDVNMPNLDGHGVLAAVRQNPKIRDVPFVFLTALAERGDQRQGMSLGADDYITKPFSEEDILQAIAARTGRIGGLRQKIQALVEQQKQESGAQWSHELLTPLNAILGSLDILDLEGEGLDPTELKEILGLVRSGAERQERLSRKLIRHFELEQRRQQHPAPAEPVTEVRDAVSRGAFTAARRAGREPDLKLEVDPGSVRLHEAYLHDAVAELVENACKFSQPGTPISVHGGSRSGHYRIEVTDQGVGMTPEQAARIGAFVQFDRAKREQQGLGLGLAIVRSVAGLGGGRLELIPESPGLTAVLDLPLA